MRIVRPFKHAIGDTVQPSTSGRPAKPTKQKKEKKCAIL